MKMAGSFSCDLCAIELKLKRDMLLEIAMISNCLCGSVLAGGFLPALHMQAGRQCEIVNNRIYYENASEGGDRIAK